MKVITRCVIAFDGTVLEEDSYEYHGPVALCFGGDDDAVQAQEAGDRAFQLQLKQFQFQKEQAKKLEELRSGEEAKLAAEQQRILSLKQQGQQSTIKTIETRPSFETFRAKFRQENPPDTVTRKNTKKQLEELVAKKRVSESFKFKRSGPQKRADELNKELEIQFERRARQAFEQETPIKRQAFDPNLLVKRKRLTSNA